MKTHPRTRIALFQVIPFSLICFLLTVSVLPQENPPYRNPKLPLEQRIADLLSRMTLEEKIAQITSAMSGQ